MSNMISPKVARRLELRGVKISDDPGFVKMASWTRMTFALCATFVGLGTVFSFNIWKEKTLSIPYVFDDLTFFDTLDYLTANIMLPLGGLFIAIFAAWVMRKESTQAELATNPVIYKIWRVLVRFIAPLAVIVVFLNAVGALKI